MDQRTGAQPTIYCAVEESLENVTGKFYNNCHEAVPNKLALDEDLARRLWDKTYILTS